MMGAEDNFVCATSTVALGGFSSGSVLGLLLTSPRRRPRATVGTKFMYAAATP